MTIDPKTGLAQLPDDLFWRVEKDNRNSWDGRKKTQHAGLRLQLIRKTAETVKGERIERTEKVQRSGFWSRLFLGDYETKTVVDETPDITEETEEEVYALSTFLTYSTKEDSDEHEVKEGFLYWHKDTWSSRNYYLKPGPVTAEALTDLSKEVLTSWINKQHEEALAEDKARYRDAFLGDYPPKSLALAGV